MVATSLPLGSGVQFLRISSATVCWVLPSDLAIVASLLPPLSPASILSLSAQVIGLLPVATSAPVPRARCGQGACARARGRGPRARI